MDGGGGGGRLVVVLITGCSNGGIGHSLALEFAAKGCRVVATSRAIRSMEDLDGKPGISLQALDVSSQESVDRAVRNVIREYGHIDVLVNNAGVLSVGPLVELPLQTFENTFDTNVFGPMRLIQAVIPHMMMKKKGKLVNVGSVTALAPGPWTGAYIASKAALHAMTDVLRLELKSFNIDVINVVPGGIKSNIAKNSLVKFNHYPEWKFYKPFEAAIRTRAEYSQGLRSTPTKEFAEKTVAAVLRENPPAWFSYGQFSTIFAVVYYLPLWLRDFLFRKILKC